MRFQLLKLVLWPRDEGEPRVVDFLPGTVNVISGSSKTGKSAVIPIVDYCLASEKCSIPVGVIREKCSWFGVVVETIEGQKLFARREPEDQRSTDDMFVMEDTEVEVPPAAPSRNSSARDIRLMLSRLSGLTNLDLEDRDEPGFHGRPSFRDLMAFTFQPQNIVANPNVLFFKADTSEHRETLKAIFPYVLGAVTSDTLLARHQLEGVRRDLRRKENEVRALERNRDAWKSEAQNWLHQARDLGLVGGGDVLPTEWTEIIDLMRQISQGSWRTAQPNAEGVDATLARLSGLRTEESQIAIELQEHRQRLNEIRRLYESSDAYGSALRVQRERLGLAAWIENRLPDGEGSTVAAISDGGRREIEALCASLRAIEVRIKTQPRVSDTLDSETVRLQRSAAEAFERLQRTRNQIVELERRSEDALSISDRFDRIERFLGRVDQQLALYDRIDENADLTDELARLKDEERSLVRQTDNAAVTRRLENALKRVATIAGRAVPNLDAEWPDAPIELVIRDLTVKVIRESREDYLWEVGSGANWLAYHVAMTLALQMFFLREVHHPVPGLLIYDQPSQVYFPAQLTSQERIGDLVLRDEDILAVRKVFELLGKAVGGVEGRLQVIILDHAGKEVWGGLDHVHLIQEWRGETKLVPDEWTARS